MEATANKKIKYAKGKNSKGKELKAIIKAIPETGYKTLPKMGITPYISALITSGRIYNQNILPHSEEDKIFLRTREWVNNINKKQCLQASISTIKINDEYYMVLSYNDKNPTSAIDLFNILTTDKTETDWQAIFAIHQQHQPNDIFDATKGWIAIEQTEKTKKTYSATDENNTIQTILTTIKNTIVVEKSPTQEKITTRRGFVDTFKYANYVRIAKIKEPIPFSRDRMNRIGLATNMEEMTLMGCKHVITEEERKISSGFSIVFAPKKEDFYEEATIKQFNLPFKNATYKNNKTEHLFDGIIKISIRKEKKDRNKEQQNTIPTHHEMKRTTGGGTVFSPAVNEGKIPQPKWNNDAIFSINCDSAEEMLKTINNIPNTKNRVFIELQILSVISRLPNNDISIGEDMFKTNHLHYAKEEIVKDVLEIAVKTAEQQNDTTEIQRFTNSIFAPENKVKQTKIIQPTEDVFCTMFRAEIRAAIFKFKELNKTSKAPKSDLEIVKIIQEQAKDSRNINF